MYGWLVQQNSITLDAPGLQKYNSQYDVYVKALSYSFFTSSTSIHTVPLSANANQVEKRNNRSQIITLGAHIMCMSTSYFVWWKRLIWNDSDGYLGDFERKR